MKTLTTPTDSAAPAARPGPRLKPGDPAPEARVFDIQGREVSLPQTLAGQATLLTFLRHFG